MIEQLLVIVGVVSAFSAVTEHPQQQITTDRAPHVAGGIVVIVSAGDFFSRHDAYSLAMARLVAEQKQLTWIEQHLQKIDDHYDEVDKEVWKGRELILSGSHANEEDAKKFRQESVEALRTKEKVNDENRERRAKPWVERYKKQLERIEQARADVDKLTK